MKKTIFYLFIVILFAACASDAGSDKPTKGYTKLDLLSQGVPFPISAPEGVKIETGEIGLYKNITVKKEDYSIEILISEAVTTDLAKVMEEEKENVRSEGIFSKMVKEEPDGFIFETKIDENVNYDFRHIRIQGDKVYRFRGSLIGAFTLEQAENMYKSVKFK